MDLAEFRIPMNEIYSSIVSLWKIVYHELGELIIEMLSKESK